MIVIGRGKNQTGKFARSIPYTLLVSPSNYPKSLYYLDDCGSCVGERHNVSTMALLISVVALNLEYIKGNTRLSFHARFITYPVQPRKKSELCRIIEIYSRG